MFKSYDMKGFGECLRHLRKSLKYTQKDVESLTRLSCESLRKIESGLVVPRYDTLEFLSLAYKTDVLRIFSRYRSSQKLFDFYSYLDKIIVGNEHKSIDKLIEDFKTVVNFETKMELLNHIEIEQLLLVLNGLKDYYDKNAGDGFDSFKDALLLSIPDFEFEKLKQFKYSRLELRILLLCSLSLSERDEFLIANEILLKCIKCTFQDGYMEKVDKLMMIKVYFNLSYNFHELIDYKSALYYAEKGKKFCIENHLNFLFAGLYYRSGIAKYYLKKKDYVEDIMHSINILKAIGDNELAKLYKKITFEKYKITLPE